MDNRVYVTLLGRFSLTYCGREARESRCRDCARWQLMKYLVVNRERPVETAELSRLLWPGEGSVEASLRPRLRELRGVLGRVGLGSAKSGLVLYDEGRLFINGAFELLTDMDEVLRLYALACEPGLPAGERAELRREALALYRGEYLENTQPAPWTAPGRARSRRLYGRLLTLPDAAGPGEPGRG